LVSEYTRRTVGERNFKGEVLWEKAVTGILLGARRLPNGRTFVVTRNRLFELDGAGRESNVIDRPNDVVAACRLRTGHTVLVTNGGQCIRFDASGKEIKSFPVGVLLAIGSNIDVRPGGHVVVPLYSRNQVVEYDAEGKVVWSAAVSRPCSVQRLPNGHTLVASRVGNAVVELDRRGEEVWRQRTAGRVLRAMRR
jgi:outer membrane protein assembly factor BamB